LVHPRAPDSAIWICHRQTAISSGNDLNLRNVRLHLGAVVRPAAGTLTVTLDVLAISWWLTRRGHPFYRIAFNVFALPASLWVGAEAFYWLSAIQPLALTTQPVQISTLLFPLIVFTITYFLLNSWLIAVAISFETKTSPHAIWRDNFAWLSLNYFGGASVAALLVTYTRNLDYTYVAFVLPIVGCSVLHILNGNGTRRRRQ
jgi:hypothetical protein